MFLAFCVQLSAVCDLEAFACRGLNLPASAVIGKSKASRGNDQSIVNVKTGLAWRKSKSEAFRESAADYIPLPSPDKMNPRPKRKRPVSKRNKARRLWALWEPKEEHSSGCAAYTMPVSRVLLEQIKKLVPPLDGSLHKGQSGMPRRRLRTGHSSP